MKRRLFEDLVVSQDAPRRRSRYALPVSIAVHGVLIAAAVVAPMLAASDLPAAATARAVFDVPTAVLVPALPRVPPPPPRQQQHAAPSHGRSREAGRPALPPPPNARPSDPGPVVNDAEEVPVCLTSCGADDSARPPGVGVGTAIVDPLDSEIGVPPIIRISRSLGPAKLHDAAAVYPDLARQARVQGTVTIDCTIDPQGRVVNATVLKGHPLLDRAALDAVQQWVYRPMLMNGVPVSVIMTVTVRFVLAR